MAIPAGYSRGVIYGTLTGGEIFETGHWFEGAATSDTDAQAAADAMRDGITDHVLSAAAAMLSTDSALVGVRVYAYPTGGPRATYTAESLFASTPGTGTVKNADQLSIVTTLLTGAAGRRNRGRMYWPANGVAPTNGYADFSRCEALASGLSDYFQTQHLGGADAVVMSQTAGSARPITSVRVDNRYDIQRRRANREAAGGSATYPLGG